MRISDWSSDVCSSDLGIGNLYTQLFFKLAGQGLQRGFARFDLAAGQFPPACPGLALGPLCQQQLAVGLQNQARRHLDKRLARRRLLRRFRPDAPPSRAQPDARSEEHTSELQSLMRISDAV